MIHSRVALKTEGSAPDATTDGNQNRAAEGLEASAFPTLTATRTGTAPGRARCSETLSGCLGLRGRLRDSAPNR
jgi:hypothetical protein